VPLQASEITSYLPPVFSRVPTRSSPPHTIIRSPSNRPMIPSRHRCIRRAGSHPLINRGIVPTAAVIEDVLRCRIRPATPHDHLTTSPNGRVVRAPSGAPDVFVAANDQSRDRTSRRSFRGEALDSPQTIISLPVQTALWSERHCGAVAARCERPRVRDRIVSASAVNRRSVAAAACGTSSVTSENDHFITRPDSCVSVPALRRRHTADWAPCVRGGIVSAGWEGRTTRRMAAPDDHFAPVHTAVCSTARRRGIGRAGAAPAIRQRVVEPACTGDPATSVATPYDHSTATPDGGVEPSGGRVHLSGL
jgi:hypothetical protein